MRLRAKPLSTAAAKLPSLRAAIVDATLRSIAVGYPLAILLFMVSLRLVGEQWWGTTIALYLPRAPFALPLLPLIFVLAWIGPRSLLWTQLVAFGLLLGLMGFRVAWPTTPTPGAFHLRIVSCNIHGGGLGLGRILKPLRERDPDIIVLQEVDPNGWPRLKELVPGYFTHASGQFWLASRYPIESAIQPQAQFARYRIITPAGPVVLFNVHPVSPRDGLETVRGDGLRHQFLRGDLLNARARDVVLKNTSLRLSQLRVIANSVRNSSADPVLIAGDTNLPDLSWALAHWLEEYRDGFATVGSGFGYSFPSPRYPWMRIDRVMADGQHFRFRSFEVINKFISDHFAVVSELELIPSRP